MIFFVDPLPYVTFCDTLAALKQECQSLFEVTLTTSHAALSAGDKVVVGAFVVVTVSLSSLNLS